MSGRSPPLYCTLILITMRSHQSYPNITTVIHSYEYSTNVDNSTIETYRNRGLVYCIISLIFMQGYCTNTQDTREAWVTTQFVTLPLGSDGCFKKKSEQMYPVMGEKTNKRLGGIKGCKVFKEKSERYITSRNGWVSLKGIFRWYICSLLYHI